MYVGCSGTCARQISIATSRSPDFRYSFARRAKTRRGFSANCFRRSSIRAELAIQAPRGGRAAGGGEESVKIHESDDRSQSEVIRCLDFTSNDPITLLAQPARSSHVVARSQVPCFKACGAPPGTSGLCIAVLFLIGFVFYQQSGLSGQKVTAGTTVATVNGTSIPYLEFEQRRAEPHSPGAGRRRRKDADARSGASH